MNERSESETLAVVWMDMFCTGNTPIEEIEFYRQMADGSHDNEDYKAAVTLAQNLDLLVYMADHAELLFERVILAVKEAKEKHEAPET